MSAGLVHLAGLLATPSGPAGDRALLSAWILFGIIAALLALFVLIVALLVVIRRQRRAAPRRDRPEEPTVDPWAEAGQRVRPYPDREKKG